ncbi:MAG: hypothetical protein A2Z95_10460 [Gallionellales bacterium GWA2_60_18]|nr:MAG: hypothetical protein A2Z95_10460 [Gallionellales bacterium GWA2_60_18]
MYSLSLTRIIQGYSSATYAETTALHVKLHGLPLRYIVRQTQHIFTQYLSGGDAVAQQLSECLFWVGKPACLGSFRRLTGDVSLLQYMSRWQLSRADQ